MNEKKNDSSNIVRYYSIAINFVLLYYVLLVLIMGMTVKGVVDAIAYIFVLYGIPLGIAIIIYIIAAFDFVINRNYFFHDSRYIIFIVSTVKTLIAILPMFFLDDKLAKVLVFIREFRDQYT